MAGRPEKYTVSYFPHYTRDGKTIFILENKFGATGYAFWFKLLELLCNSNNIYYDCRDNQSLEYLSATLKVTSDQAMEILNTLSDLEKIDKELWQNRIIWCQSLVDNLSDIFKRRKTDIPEKPLKLINVNNKPINANNNSINVNNKPISAPQSKVNKSKVNKINNIAPTSIKKSEQKPKIVFNFENEKWEGITDKDLELWSKAYPACQLNIEFAKMKAWILASGTRGKKSNWKRFINNWLNRSQDRGGTKT